MVLIVSKEKFENSTEDVIDWLFHFNQPFLRINGDEFYRHGNLHMKLSNKTQTSIEFKGIDLLKLNFSAAWFRRWSDYSDFNRIKELNLDFEKCDALLNNLANEERTLKNFFLSQLKVEKWLTSPNETTVNKLVILNRALKCGLNIPDSFVCSKKNQLQEILNDHKELIVKPISDGISYFVGDYWITNYTEFFSISNLDRLGDSFSPTLFQVKIEKKYELRCFFLDTNFYCMCIHSQTDKQTEVDFRKYNRKRPNRTVPYNLPKDVELSLQSLIKLCGLKTGSIDLIKATNNKYYFLEINPVGQFGMTSFPCNYNLEKKIAEYLINN